ncbi:MAG: M23 family metallopeptidase, partial [Pseudomonadota bacterium]
VDNALGRRRAQGGPYFVAASQLGLSDAFETAATDAADAISRWEALRDVLRLLPLESPMDQYRVTSGFGRRTDPINGRPAMHYGLDLAHAMSAPILATSPGKVVFSGWKGNYGRFVEIDHGAGVRTRYGHLHKILVRRGETVDFRQKIGTLGNSGRSTGPHLHYEITVDGRPLNPQKFIAAGRYVLKEW